MIKIKLIMRFQLLQILFFLPTIWSSALVHANCDGFLEKSVYAVPELTREVLESLVGATIKFDGKYSPYKSKDNRLIEGEGIVQAVASWTKGLNPSFTIHLRSADNKAHGVQVFIDDPSFRLTLLMPSKLPDLFSKAAADGFKIRKVKGLLEPANEAADFLRDPMNQKLRIFYFVSNPENKSKISIAELSTVQSFVPDNMKVILAELQSQPVAFEFLTMDNRKASILASDIIAIAHPQ